MSNRAKLSAAMLALIAAGASAPVLMDQFLNEKEGNSLTAYQDAGGVWTICRGVTLVDGKSVIQGMKRTQEKCDRVNAIERDKALAWVERNIHVTLTDPQKVGIASFCPYNIGPGKCFPSTFYQRINSGDRNGACEAIRWWIKDGGRDCRLTKGQKNGCYGQVERRDQESALTCWAINHYRDNALGYKKQRDDKTQALGLANATITDMQTRQRDVAALDAKYTKELADAQTTIDLLHDDVTTGKRRLQLNAKCPANIASGTTGVDDATSPRLTEAARRDYFTLRERIEIANKQIAGLQQYVLEQCR